MYLKLHKKLGFHWYLFIYILLFFGGNGKSFMWNKISSVMVGIIGTYAILFLSEISYNVRPTHSLSVSAIYVKFDFYYLMGIPFYLNNFIVITALWIFWAYLSSIWNRPNKLVEAYSKTILLYLIYCLFKCVCLYFTFQK